MSQASAVSLNLLKPLQLTVCTIDNFAPIIFRDEQGQWQGVEVNILQSFAKCNKLKLEFKIAPFDGIWCLPAKGQCDIVAAGLSISHKHERDGAAFTEPYLFIEQSLLVKRVNKQESDGDAIARGNSGKVYQAKKYPKFTLLELDDTDEKFALVVAEHNQLLLQLLNEHITKLRETGELQKIYEKWC